MRDRRWWLTLPLQLKHTLHIATSHNILPRCFRWHACRFSTPSSTTVVFSCEGIGRCRPHRRLGEEIGVLSPSQSNAITTTVLQGKPPATSARRQRCRRKHLGRIIRLVAIYIRCLSAVKMLPATATMVSWGNLR